MNLPLYPRSIDPNDVQKLFDTTQSLEPKAVWMQILVMTALSILTLLAFNTLRPVHKVIYEPKTKYHAPDKTPPRISDAFCGWIPPLIHNHERELSQKIGLDAVAFLRFLHLLRWLFTYTALITCGALLPLDFLYTVSVKPSRYNFLSAMTIRDVHGVRLFAHIGSTYLITLFIAVLVHNHWRAIYRLRNQWFRSAEYQNLFYARTLCVTHIPERRQSDAGLYKIFTGMQLPYPVTSVHIGRSVGHLPKLIKIHNETVKKLKKLVLKYMDQSERARPTIRVGGWCGMGGKREDAITFYTAKLKHTEAVVQQYRAQLDLRKPENYGFASISSIPFAHAAARDLRGEHPKGLTIKLAPNPKDIIWKNLGLSKPLRRFRKTTGFVLLLLFCLLSLAPLFPIASLANLDAIAASGYIPFLSRWSISSPTTYTLASGVVPPAIAAVFSYFLPRLMWWLSKYMGAHTFSSLDRVVIARYFTFLVVSQLVLFTVIGVLFHSVLEIISALQTEGASLKTIFENLDKLPARIARTYVDQSSFWLKWFPMQGFFAIFDLAQVFNVMQVSVKNRLFGRTPRDIHEWTKPPVFEYSIYYSHFLFMAAVGLLFAPLAPLVSLAAAIVFWLCSWVYKYQLMFVFVTRVESGGRAWNVVVNRLLVSAMFMQVIMIFTIGLQFEFKSFQFLATIPPLLFVLLFKHYINKMFANDFQYYIPRNNELSRSIVHAGHTDIHDNKLEQRYCNPALQADLFSPMVHSKMMTSLRRVYKAKDGGRRDGDMTRGIEKESRSKASHDLDTDEDMVEGVRFIPVHEIELEYDPELYTRDREEVDCDLDSVNSRSSSDNHTYTPPLQSVSEYRRHVGRPTDTLYRGSGYKSQLPYPPTIPASSPPYTEGVWGAAPNRQYQRHPSPLSPAPSYQLADNHIHSRQSSRVRTPNEYVNEPPRNHHITETRRRSRDRQDTKRTS